VIDDLLFITNYATGMMLSNFDLIFLNFVLHSAHSEYMHHNNVILFWTMREQDLKVVGNEKVGGSRRWHMIDIGLRPW
jgi:hypothetical protein